MQGLLLAVSLPKIKMKERKTFEVCLCLRRRSKGVLLRLRQKTGVFFTLCTGVCLGPTCPFLKPCVAQVNGTPSSVHAHWLSLSLHRKEFRGPVSTVHSRPRGFTQTHTNNTNTPPNDSYSAHTRPQTHICSGGSLTCLYTHLYTHMHTHTVGLWLKCSNRRDVEMEQQGEQWILLRSIAGY